MRKGSLLISMFLWLLAAMPAQASDAPEYDTDPFGDFDVDALPLILEQRFVSNGASELGLLFQTSLIDRYSSHIGGLLDYTYFFTETVGLNVSGGYANGSLSGLVTGPEGVIGQAVSKCRLEPADCDLQPNLPDFKELTYVASVSAIWAPLYGKINIVSELALNLQVYGIAGAGIHGLREPTVRNRSDLAEGFDVEYENLSPAPHATFGGGLKIYVLDDLAIRAEARGLFYLDKFDFIPEDADPTETLYLTNYVMGQFGLSYRF